MNHPVLIHYNLRFFLDFRHKYDDYDACHHIEVLMCILYIYILLEFTGYITCVLSHI